MNSIDLLIEKYQLEAHPEGGYFREIYRSEQELLSPVSNESRNSITHIYFLLKQGQYSRFHRVWHDEIWNFYEGAPLRLIEFDGEHIEEKRIGENGKYVSVVKGGVFQAAESIGEYTLVGCSVAPGFDFKDFSFIQEEPNLLNIINQQYADYSYLL